MKKITSLIMIALILVIGGVYATWNYAKTDLISGSKTLDGITLITDAVVEGAKGSIEVDVSGLSITIDDANNDHVAECVFDGEVVVKFTPSQGAHVDVKAGEINLAYSLSVSPNWAYQGVNVFTVDAAAVSLGDYTGTAGADQATGNTIYTWTIPAADLDTKIAFYTTGAATGADGSLALETPAEHTDFKNNYLHGGAIAITVNEVDAQNA